MLPSHIRHYKSVQNNSPQWNKNYLIKGILESRNLFEVQTLSQGLNGAYASVCSMDINIDSLLVLLAHSNGTVELQGIKDTLTGELELIGMNTEMLPISNSTIHRVQWCPTGGELFSAVDKHFLNVIDAGAVRILDKYRFEFRAAWSEWNPNDVKMIAVCGTESQTRLVDIRSGSSIQTIIVEANSRLASHRTTRCLWSKHDINCLIIGDNEGFIHVYDTRKSSRPLAKAGCEHGQISGMSFTTDQNDIITAQGTQNHLVQWSFDKRTLKARSDKFKKKEKVKTEQEIQMDEPQTSGTSGFIRKKCSLLRRTVRVLPLPVDAYIRCQPYVTDTHVFCPVPSSVKKSKEVYVYDIDSGYRIKTLKSDDISNQGVYWVTGLLPDSMVIYTCGRGRVKVWTIDEDHQRKKEAKRAKYHRTQWESDEEL